MEKTNEWYEMIDDEGLQSNESYDEMILVCPMCNALFQEKACGMRTIFPWFGYHPTDGNCQVITEKFARVVEARAVNCSCKVNLERVTAKKKLDEVIESY